MAPFAFHDATSLLNEVLDLSYFHPLTPEEGGETPIPSYLRPGQGQLVVIVGENASGKSFFRRLVCAVCAQCEPRIECINISLEGRGQDFGGVRSLIYGCEEYESTGVNSTHTVLTGIHTCQTRETPHVMLWDEPDLGLSESGAAGMGQAIATYTAAPNPLTLATLVVTHSRPLAERLAPLNPHYLYLGDGEPQKSLQDWLARPIVPRDPEDIRAAGHRRFKLIQKVLDRKKNLDRLPADGSSATGSKNTRNVASPRASVAPDAMRRKQKTEIPEGRQAFRCMSTTGDKIR